MDIYQVTNEMQRRENDRIAALRRTRGELQRSIPALQASYAKHLDKTTREQIAANLARAEKGAKELTGQIEARWQKPSREVLDAIHYAHSRVLGCLSQCSIAAEDILHYIKDEKPLHEKESRERLSAAKKDFARAHDTLYKSMEAAGIPPELLCGAKRAKQILAEWEEQER